MRVIIRPNADELSKWAALYIKKRINEFKPTQDKPFVLGRAEFSIVALVRFFSCMCT